MTAELKVGKVSLMYLWGVDMADSILIYLVIGLVVNVLTMLDSEIWEYWIEFGIFGFLFQLAFSIVFFPLVLYGIFECIKIK